jgi:hypothetical protein
VAAAVCEFRDEDSARASFGAPESGVVMRDVGRYTDLSPVQLLNPLESDSGAPHS